ncbi:MAG: hypothetical protein ACK6EB_33680, partial [Planctomyces sp.]
TLGIDDIRCGEQALPYNPGPFLRARTPSSAAATVNRHQLRVPGSQYDIQNTLFRNTPDDLIAFGHESFPGAL